MRVLILGTCKQPHLWLMRAGHEAVLMITKDKVTPEDLKAGYRQLIVVDSRSADLVGLAEHLHRVEKFDAVCSYSDVWQPLANRVADALELPRPVPQRVLELTMNKSKMRAHLAEAGIEETSHRLVESREQIEQALQALGAPCILKPIEGEASSGVTRLDGDGDIDRAIARFRDSGHAFPALVEKFLTGDEYSVEAISEAGRHYILSITKKYKDEVTFVEKGHVVPAPLADDVAEAIRAHLTRVLDAIELTRGPSHSEMVLTELGPRMIETHTRVGGDRIPELVRLATGIDLYELCARQSLGESIAERLPATVTYQGAAAIWYACPAVSPDMVLSRVEENDAVRSLPGIDTVQVSKQVGDRGGPVHSSFDRTAFVVARGNDAGEAFERARAGAELLRFHYCWLPARAGEEA
jgi:biotin carboxylase